MKAKLMVLENIHKNELVRFEKSIRESEPDIWTKPFEEIKYMQAIGAINLKNHDKNVIIGAFIDDVMVGRCDIVFYNSLMDFTKTAYIDWLYVDITHRQTGIAKALVSTAKEYAEKQNASSTYLFTASNEDARAFYNTLPQFTLEMREVAYSDKE